MLITGNVEQEFKNAMSEREQSESAPSSGANFGTWDDVEKAFKKRGRNIDAAVSVTQLMERFYNPFWQRMQWELPADRKKLNAFRRHFYHSEPLIGSIIDLHTEFPISTFKITHEDRDIKEYFQEMIDELRLFDFLSEAVREYWIIGESFPFGIFDDPDNPTEWEDFILLNPDYTNVQILPLGRGNYETIKLQPSDSLKKILSNGPGHEDTGDLYDMVPGDVVNYVNEGADIPLSRVCVSHIKKGGHYFDPHSKSIIDRVMKDIMYRDKLREAQFAVASRHVAPTELYLIGDSEDPADDAEIQNFRSILEQTWTDPTRAIVYHHALRAEVIGASGNILNLGPEFDRIEGNILAGLMVSKQFISGEGPTFAGMSVALDILIARYLSLRRKIEQWFEDKVFRPICMIHELWKPRRHEYDKKFKFGEKSRKKIPWVPQIKWDRANLTDNVAKTQLLMSIKEGLGIVSSTSILSSIDIDPDSEVSQIEDEKNTTLDPLTNRGQPMQGAMPSQSFGAPPGMGESAAPPGEESPEVGEGVDLAEDVINDNSNFQSSEMDEKMDGRMFDFKTEDIKETSKKRPARSDRMKRKFKPDKITPEQKV